VRAQIQRMNESVEYHLQRAAASGRIALRAPVSVAPAARKIADSLAKVYRDKHLDLQVDVAPDARFYGDEGDLLEVLGNLADNACKWAERRVAIRASRDALGGAGERLLLTVDDDGPGVPAALRSTIADRGARADPSTPGHGIGLAVVRDIVEEVYQGELTIGRATLGGASIEVAIPGPGPAR
jgi:two-component system sensor histidine kinase PhoQ